MPSSAAGECCPRSSGCPRRALWLGCCGHRSHFKVNGVTYPVMAPMPGEGHRFDPMDGEEAAWRHLGKSVNAAMPPLTTFEHEFDYGTPTELELKHVAVFGELAQWISPSQSWHGGKIVILSRNHPLRACLRCGLPAHWKLAPELDEYEEYDDELYEEEGALRADYLDPGAFCEECVPDGVDLIPLADSPREGVNCFGNVRSWWCWPLQDGDLQR